MLLDGSNDYIQLPAGDTPTFTATTGEEAVMVVARIHDLSAGGLLYSAGASGSEAFRLNMSSGGNLTALVGDSVGTTVASTSPGTGLDDSTLRAYAGVVDDGTVAAYTSGQGIDATPDSIAALGTLQHLVPRLGSRAGSVSVPLRGEIMAFVRWPRALTATELDAASAFLLGTYA
jgi:hypothetical protein